MTTREYLEYMHQSSGHDLHMWGEAIGILEDFEKRCPNIAPILTPLIDRIVKAIQERRLKRAHDGKESELEKPGDPAATKTEGYLWWRKKVTYLNGDLMPSEGGWAGGGDRTHCADLEVLVKLLATIIHEMFHQACVDHPQANDNTILMLSALLASLDGCMADNPCLAELKKWLSEEIVREANTRDEQAPKKDGKKVAEAVATGAAAGALIGALVAKLTVGGTAIGGPVGGVIGALSGVIIGSLVYITTPC